MSDGNVWKISSLSINDPKDRFSNEGKILKSMWMLGPSKAVISKGNVTVSGGEDNKEDNSTSDDNKKGNEDNSKESDTNNSNTDSSDKDASSDSKSSSKEDNENFIRSYSILEAFSHLSLMYERGANKYADNDSGLAADKPNKESSDNKNSETSTNSGETTKKSSEDGENAQDPSDKSKGDEEKEAEEEPKDNFQYGTTYEFTIGIKDEGYTYWKVLIDKRADVNAVKAAINNKKFKQAYQIAGLKSETDGLIPVTCDTFIKKKPGGKKELQPPFIGHCRYAIDSVSEGEEDDKDNAGDKDNKIKGARDTSIKEGLTLCLAVAPINGRSKKPDEDVVIQAVYNITGDITGGAIGSLIASVQGAVRDKVLGTDSSGGRYRNAEDEDSEESQSEEISKWLHNKFRCVGDHTMYNNFLTLRNFIKKQIAEGNLELESLFVGNNKNGSHEINAQVSTFFKTKKFYTFF